MTSALRQSAGAVDHQFKWAACAPLPMLHRIVLALDASRFTQPHSSEFPVSGTASEIYRDSSAPVVRTENSREVAIRSTSKRHDAVVVPLDFLLQFASVFQRHGVRWQMAGFLPARASVIARRLDTLKPSAVPAPEGCSFEACRHPSARYVQAVSIHAASAD